MVEEINEFERELRRQLQIRDAPDGFADRVMARLPHRPQRTASLLRALRIRPVWQWAAAAVLIAAVMTGAVEHERERRLAGEHARAQVLLALRITGSTLRDVNQKIAEAGNQDGSAAPNSGEATVQ